jgi:hypothetical protein
LEILFGGKNIKMKCEYCRRYEYEKMSECQGCGASLPIPIKEEVNLGTTPHAIEITGITHMEMGTSMPIPEFLKIYGGGRWA